MRREYLAFAMRCLQSSINPSGVTFSSPVFEATLDELPEFFSADSSRAVDKQSLLLERTVNQRRQVCLSVTQCVQAVRNAGVTHQREQCSWEYLRHFVRCQPMSSSFLKNVEHF